MRISTKKSVKPVRAAYLISGGLIFLNLLFIVLKNRRTGDIMFEIGSAELHMTGTWLESYSPIFWPFIAVILFLALRGPVHFSYDTDGDVMNLKVEDLFLFFLGRYANKHYEFPKRKLIAWKLYSLPFYKMLRVDIESKTGSIRTRMLAVSYLSKKQVSSLTASLNKARALNARFAEKGDTLRRKKGRTRSSKNEN